MPYASPYDQRYRGQSLNRDLGPRGPRDPAGRRGAEQGSGLLRMLGALAPAAGGIAGGIIGGAAGGVPGAVAGAGIGTGAGQGLNSLANFGADEQMRPYDEAEAKRFEAEQKRQARQQAINNVLAQLAATRR